MSIGASEHRTSVRAKARFAGQKAQEHSFVRRNAVTPDILPCIVGGIFWRKVPRVPCPSRSPSVRPVRSHSLPEERLLPGPPRHSPLPGVSLFWRFRCYLDRPPALHGLLRYPSPPGVSRFRRIGSHLRRVTRYQALWQRPPAPDAPLKRGISFAKTRRFRAADYSPRPAPVRGTFAVAWNIAVRTRGVFTHRTGFQKLACAERGLVRTGRPRQTHTIQKTALWRTQGT